MENRINIAELLRECPQGMELNCTLYYNVFFDKICEDDLYPIKCYTIDDGIRNSVDFTKYGEFHTLITSKCVIFPKGKTTWEGFVPPFKFKDGDILFVEAIYDWIFIYKENENKENLYKHAATTSSDLVHGDIPLCNREYVKEIRFATEEEKRKLFNAIKINGYRWNTKTKTLETLIKPKFKIGDKVRHKNNYSVIFTITSIEEDSYICGVATAFWFEDQDNYELVPNKFDIHTLTPLQPVLVRNTNGQVWTMDFFSHIIDTNKGLKPSIVCVGHCPNQCIPYKGNEFLRGTADECKDFYKTWES